MATHTLGTNANSSLTALKLRPYKTAVGGTLAAPADVAQIDGLIADDKQLLNAGVIGSATASNGNNTLTSVSIATGSFSQIQKGQWAYGPGIPGGTQVVSTSGSSVVLSGNYVGGGGSITVFFLGSRLPDSFSKNNLLYVPNRGVLRIHPGDAVGVDASGWPILVSAEALAYSASSWTFT
jgi:hypothetical protein